MPDLLVGSIWPITYPVDALVRWVFCIYTVLLRVFLTEMK